MTATSARTAHATAALAEADRLMTICNACRYCEGLCAVFPAMEMRRTFGDGDLDYLANLCHGCGACYVDCQFSPPHEFDVNVPKVLAEVRAESYARHAWPTVLQPVFDRAGVVTALVSALTVGLFLLESDGTGGLRRPADFYAVFPHGLLATVFGAAFAVAIVAMIAGAYNYQRRTGAGPAGAGTAAALRQAIADAATLRYLDGGGAGCGAEKERGDRRRLYHHVTVLGFLAAFAATTVGTLYHYLLGREAPYPWYDLPVVLGTLGGVGLLVGPIGLWGERRARDPALAAPASRALDDAFLGLLVATSATGLLLLALRATDWMSPLLAIHLGVVLTLFVLAPYGKAVHGLYRFLALVRYARERAAQAREVP